MFCGCFAGLIFIIGPWNFPLLLVFQPLVGAIAAGNCALLKPSEVAKASEALIAELCAKSVPRPNCPNLERGGRREEGREVLARFLMASCTCRGWGLARPCLLVRMEWGSALLWLLRSGLLLLPRRYLDQSAIRCLTGAVPETTELLSMHWDHIFYTGNVSFFKCDPCLLDYVLCLVWLLTVVLGCHMLVGWLVG